MLLDNETSDDTEKSFRMWNKLTKKGDISSFTTGVAAERNKLCYTVMDVLGLCGKVLVAGSCRGGFCQKMPEAAPISDRANSCWLQDGTGDGQG